MHLTCSNFRLTPHPRSRSGRDADQTEDQRPRKPPPVWPVVGRVHHPDRSTRGCYCCWSSKPVGGATRLKSSLNFRRHKYEIYIRCCHLDDNPRPFSSDISWHALGRCSSRLHHRKVLCKVGASKNCVVPSPHDCSLRLRHSPPLWIHRRQPLSAASSCLRRSKS